jgi:hypothetical protein
MLSLSLSNPATLYSSPKIPSSPISHTSTGRGFVSRRGSTAYLALYHTVAYCTVYSLAIYIAAIFNQLDSQKKREGNRQARTEPRWLYSVV